MVYRLTKDNKDEILSKVLSDTADFISVCESFGYGVRYPFFEKCKDSNNLFCNMRLKADVESYLPQIAIVEADEFGRIDINNIKFAVSQCSYNFSDSTEFEKFVNAQNKAFQFLQWLNNYKDWDKFPVIVRED